MQSIDRMSADTQATTAARVLALNSSLSHWRSRRFFSSQNWWAHSCSTASRCFRTQRICLPTPLRLQVRSLRSKSFNVRPTTSALSFIAALKF